MSGRCSRCGDPLESIFVSGRGWVAGCAVCAADADPRAAGVVAYADLARDEIVLAIGGAPLRFAVHDARRLGAALLAAVATRDAALVIDETFAVDLSPTAGEEGAAAHPDAAAAPSDRAFSPAQGVY